MAETSWPFPDPANSNKRIVTDTQFEQFAHPQAADGLIGTPSDPALIYGDDSGMQVKVRASRLAVLRGHGWASDSSGKTLTIAANASGSTRVDLVVLRLTRSTWKVTTEVRQGIPGSPAPTPVTDLGATGVYEITLAEVSVPSGDTLIGAAQVTPRAWYLGSDGQILCTATTRPPHEAGRRIYEPGTGVGSMSTGSSWVVVYEDSGPLSFTMAPGWALSVGSLRHRDGTVAASLSVRRTGGNLGASGDVQVATIPAGLPPLTNVEGPAHVLNIGTTIGAYGSNRAVTVRLSSGISTNNYVILSPATWH